MGATVLFAGGLGWSFWTLGIRPWELAPAPVLILLCLFGPLGIAYGAVGMLLLARAGGASLKFGPALKVDAWAQLAEALPVPGGAIVRAGALVGAGAMAGRSALLVIGSALLWISLASLAAGLVLALGSVPAAAWLAAAGLAGTLAVLAWLGWQAGWRITAWTLLHRLAGLVINAARLKVAFAAVHAAIPIQHALPFALASIAGSAASIAPAGLGVSETLAALMARSVAVAAPAAFLAVAVNRLLALLAAGLFMFIAEGRKDRHNKGMGADGQPGTA